MATKGDAPTGSVSGTEAMLDAEYITALGTHVESEFWGFSGRNPDNKNNEPFLKWLQTVSNTSDDDVPKVFSTSYGEDEDSVSLDYATRMNTEFMKAGTRGISLLFASGDSGAAGDSHTCKNGKFVPQFPASSPYITAVGGTSGGGLAPPETAAGIASGGFSNRWARPSWQDTAVQKYKQGPRVAALKSRYNDTGRGFPDISAQAMSFVVVQEHIPLPGVSGTSCASPTAAGVFGLLNDVRKQAGKPPLGFLNPFIYKNAAGFNDITRGGNTGCPSTAMQGFPAVAGWDAVTGMGTPNYAALKATAMGQAAIVV
jgi:tripeptidyl-peptidase-1